MRFVRDRVIIITALILALISIWGKYQWDSQHRDLVEALVAKEHIQQYSIITKEQLGLKLIPSESLENNSYKNPNEAIGKMNMVELWPGEQLLKQKFDEADIKPKPGEVLIGVETDLAKSVGGELVPGDLIQLKVRYKPETGRRDAETVLEKARIFSIKDTNGQSLGINVQSNIPLLSFGQTTTTDTQGAQTSGSYNPNNTPKTMPKVVVIKVKETESNKVIEKAGLGELVFAKLPY